MQPFSIYLSSCLLGVSVAAPIGPINIEIIRRGLTQSSRAAFFLGCGAVTADCCYFSLAMIGAQTAAAIIDSPWLLRGGLGLGAGMLIWLGIGAIRKVREIQPVPAVAATLSKGAARMADRVPPIWRTYGLGLALTLANPMTIALWLSVATGFAASGSAGGTPYLRLAGVFSGAISWVCFITSMTAWARRWITPATLQAVNVASGLILLVYGVRFALRIFTV